MKAINQLQSPPKNQIIAIRHVAIRNGFDRVAADLRTAIGGKTGH
jgi:hypothetical protein